MVLTEGMRRRFEVARTRARDEWLKKDHPGMFMILEEVKNQYNGGRVTAFSDQEIQRMIEKFLPEHYHRFALESSGILTEGSGNEKNTFREDHIQTPL